MCHPPSMGCGSLRGVVITDTVHAAFATRQGYTDRMMSRVFAFLRDVIRANARPFRAGMERVVLAQRPVQRETPVTW